MGSSWSYNAKTKTVLIDPEFNGKLTGLPPDTKIIIFEEGRNCISKFNQPVNKDSFPNSITHLSFGDSFNQPVNKDSLPSFITHLSFGWFFTQPVNELPDNLIFLELPEIYHHPLNNLPYGLKTLKISEKYPKTKIKLPFGCEIITK
jgi:hypothetical protein